MSTSEKLKLQRKKTMGKMRDSITSDASPVSPNKKSLGATLKEGLSTGRSKKMNATQGIL